MGIFGKNVHKFDVHMLFQESLSSLKLHFANVVFQYFI